MCDTCFEAGKRNEISDFPVAYMRYWFYRDPSKDDRESRLLEEL